MVLTVPRPACIPLLRTKSAFFLSLFWGNFGVPGPASLPSLYSSSWTSQTLQLQRQAHPVESGKISVLSSLEGQRIRVSINLCLAEPQLCIIRTLTCAYLSIGLWSFRKLPGRLLYTRYHLISHLRLVIASAARRIVQLEPSPPLSLSSNRTASRPDAFSRLPEEEADQRAEL